MQTYHSFFPNYPPPPIPTRESLIIEGLKTLEQSKFDQEYLTTWIKRKKEEKQLSSNQITLSDYRQQLIHHAHLLRQYSYALENSHHESLVELKSQIEQSNTFIYNVNMIKNIQQKIHQRKLKRARLRRQKEKQLISIKSDHIQQQSTNEKSSLIKIQEMNSILQTIDKLKQLKTTGQLQQTDTNNTLNELIEIENLCIVKLREYQIEMATQSHNDLYNYLFNNNDRLFYESMNSDAQYFLRAHQNINDLVQIRQAWDQYSSTHILSSDNIIPSKWHKPQLPSDSNWSKYIFDQNE